MVGFAFKLVVADEAGPGTVELPAQKQLAVPRQVVVAELVGHREPDARLPMHAVRSRVEEDELAVPTVILDPAVELLAVVAGGKVEIARRTGATMPEGWVVDKEGKPMTDPMKYAEAGAILPLGGTPGMGSYKGFGLSVAVEILSSILSGALSIPQIAGQPQSRGKANHFFGALRISSFIPVDDFKNGMDGMIRVFRALPRAEGVDRITLAGEVEQRIEKERRENGIPLHPAIIASLQEVAKELGIRYNL